MDRISIVADNEKKQRILSDSRLTDMEKLRDIFAAIQ